MQFYIKILLSIEIMYVHIITVLFLLYFMFRNEVLSVPFDIFIIPRTILLAAASACIPTMASSIIETLLNNQV